jgi:hypothetical protein
VSALLTQRAAVSLNDPMFYLELAGHCLREASLCQSRTAALGLHKLAQSYLDLAETVGPQIQSRSSGGPVAKAA